MSWRGYVLVAHLPLAHQLADGPRGCFLRSRAAGFKKCLVCGPRRESPNAERASRVLRSRLVVVGELERLGFAVTDRDRLLHHIILLVPGFDGVGPRGKIPQLE